MIRLPLGSLAPGPRAAFVLRLVAHGRTGDKRLLATAAAIGHATPGNDVAVRKVRVRR